MKQDILTINRAKWRTGDEGENRTGKGKTELLNKDGYMCCLGFHCRYLGIPPKDILGKTEPMYVNWKVIPDLMTQKGFQSVFTNKAMELNDQESLTPAEREKKIKSHFAKKGIKVIFTGKYKK